eukprot:8810194-Ditylum_brightwellii.AAC.1
MPKSDTNFNPKVGAALGAYCNKTNLDPCEKICYYIDHIKYDMAQPFSTVSIKTEKLEVNDLNKLSMKQLKQILGGRGVECKGCLKKGD